jgi:hypothetical protein
MRLGAANPDRPILSQHSSSRRERHVRGNPEGGRSADGFSGPEQGPLHRDLVEQMLLGQDGGVQSVV